MAGPRFTADPPDMMRTVELDGLTALFHVPSGTTHILAPPAPQILAALAGGPATAPTILARIRRSFEVEGPRGGGERKGSALAALETRIAELEAAGLVSRL
jgi:PqqD family protein of HPr-rel-A system